MEETERENNKKVKRYKGKGEKTYLDRTILGQDRPPGREAAAPRKTELPPREAGQGSLFRADIASSAPHRGRPSSPSRLGRPRPSALPVPWRPVTHYSFCWASRSNRAKGSSAQHGGPGWAGPLPHRGRPAHCAPRWALASSTGRGRQQSLASPGGRPQPALRQPCGHSFPRCESRLVLSVDSYDRGTCAPAKPRSLLHDIPGYP